MCFEQPISLLLLVVAFLSLGHRCRYNVSSDFQLHWRFPHELSSQALGGLRNEAGALDQAPTVATHLDEPWCKASRKFGAVSADLA